LKNSKGNNREIFKPPPPVGFDMKPVSRDGKIDMKFNQKIQIPDFV